MDDIKKIIAKNIIELRHVNDITQAQLAEKLNYSDKAISKWERGESVPHIAILKEIADIFGVTVDYLITEMHDNTDTLKNSQIFKRRHRNRIMITLISIFLVWLLATFTFVLVGSILGPQNWSWMIFLHSIPISFIVWLIFNSTWFNKRLNFLIISILMWTALSCIYLTFYYFGLNLWIIFVIGVPAQAIILLWSGIRSSKK